MNYFLLAQVEKYIRTVHFSVARIYHDKAKLRWRTDQKSTRVKLQKAMKNSCRIVLVCQCCPDSRFP